MRSFTDSPVLPAGYLYSPGVALLLGWTDRRSVYARRADLPDPAFVLDGHPVWSAATIRRWRELQR